MKVEFEVDLKPMFTALVLMLTASGGTWLAVAPDSPVRPPAHQTAVVHEQPAQATPQAASDAANDAADDRDNAEWRRQMQWYRDHVMRR